MNCSPPVRDSRCYPVTEYKKWNIDIIGELSTQDQMMQEIKTYGPITCTLVVTDGFNKYDG
jgi:hypothetical protein